METEGNRLVNTSKPSMNRRRLSREKKMALLQDVSNIFISFSVLFGTISFSLRWI